MVAVNRFPTDTEAELELVENRCRALGVNVALSEVWAKGGEGGVALAEEVIRLCDAPNHFTFSYELDASIEDKLAAIVTKVYHGDGVVLTPTARKQAAELTELGFGSLPICMAKTQYSFSDNAALLGAPRGFTITVRRSEGVRSRRVPGRPHPRHHDHARPAQSARGRKGGRRRERQNLRPVLSPLKRQIGGRRPPI